MYELDVKDIKEILMDYSTIREQTRQQIFDLYRDLHDTDDLIEVISIRKNKISDMPGTKRDVGKNQDLSDIILRHQRQLRNWYKEISYEIDILLEKEEMLHRLWICYRLLPERQYRVLTEIYVHKQPWKKVEKESQESKSTFLRLVNRGLNNIKKMYDSGYPNEYLLRHSLQDITRREEKRNKGKAGMKEK